jgi:GT2 family glycosyltransferase
MIRPVSVIIPVIRPEGAERCRDAIFDNAGIPSDTFEVLALEDKERIGVAKMVAALTEQSSYDLVCFLADDTIPQPDFLLNALLAMDRLPDEWGLVGLNDGFHGEELATHWLADKRLLPLIGGEFFHTGYYHCFTDDELTSRCKALGRYVWAEDAKILHLHPMLSGRSTNREEYPGYITENFMHDQVLFHVRRRNGWKTP